MLVKIDTYRMYCNTLPIKYKRVRKQGDYIPIKNRTDSIFEFTNYKEKHFEQQTLSMRAMRLWLLFLKDTRVRVVEFLVVGNFPHKLGP